LIDLQPASVLTAGAYVCIQGLYPFAIGTKLHHGQIPVFRLGGHREPSETGWQCAAREVLEETGLRIQPLSPPTTYWADGDQVDPGLTPMDWKHEIGLETGPETDSEITPVLVVSYGRQGSRRLSLMYLAQADRLPIPSSEVKGLLLLDQANIHRLCRETLTLAQYLSLGGQAILNAEFDPRLLLEPFIQLRLLSKILTAQEVRKDDSSNE
jgi:hypothetical protein